VIYYYKNSYVADKISLDVRSPALKFGLGFFETIFYNGELVCYLEEHVSRILSSLKAYQIASETIDFGQVIREVLKQNGLTDGYARVNIYYPIEVESSPASPLIAAYPYSPEPDRTFSLAISTYHHQSHLCAHKSMNYMHFYLAQRGALRRGFDDALLTDRSGRVLETSTASLVFSDGENMFTSSAGERLPGIALEIARTVLDVSERDISLDDLPEFKHAYVLNSLIGMKPVVKIDDLTYAADPATCSQVSNSVLLL
jgi:4-amino-4-deoxychorismate lyase